MMKMAATRGELRYHPNRARLGPWVSTALQPRPGHVQSLTSLKSRAKDDQGKTYWVYPNQEVMDDFTQKNVLDIRPSITMAKNIKRMDLVLALLSREIIEAICGPLYECS